jgi:RNA polymerase sigma-70 factor, ECF subfamily
VQVGRDDRSQNVFGRAGSRDGTLGALQLLDVDLGLPSSGESYDATFPGGTGLSTGPATRSAQAADAKLSSEKATDTELAVALIAGDAAAARLALERFTPMVRGILRRGLGTDVDVEDAFQDVFFCVFRRVATLRDPASFRAFVLAITFNTLLHERRRRQKRARFTCDDELVAATLASSRDEPAASYAVIRLKRLLSRLGERERRTFLLRFCDGCTALESAETLGVSEPTVRRALAHARSRIRTWAARDPFLLDYFADGIPRESAVNQDHF